MHIGIALEGAGWHPAAWREPDARPTELFSAGYWTDLVTEAERGRADFVTFEDALSLQSTFADRPDRRTDQVRGRLDAVLIAARVAPLTRHIGLIPTIVATHTEPFHISKAIATLDYVSAGRAGVQVRISARPDEAAHFGRRDAAATQAIDLLDEAADYVEVTRRLWDSWEDDAEIRQVSSGRFVDRGQAPLHRLPGPVVQRQRTIDYPQAAPGPAAGSGPRPGRPGVLVHRPGRRHRVRDAARRGSGQSGHRRDPRGASGGRPG